MYVTHLRSMEHLPTNISTHCVDGGGGMGLGWGGGAGLGKKSYDVELLLFELMILL